MPFSKTLLRAKKQARGLHADCPAAILLQPTANHCDGPSLLDELVQQQEADRSRLRPHHHAKKALRHLGKLFSSSQGKQQQQQQSIGDLDLELAASKMPAAPAGLSKGFDSTGSCSTMAASDDGSECSGLTAVDAGEREEEELAVALAFRSLEESLHARHHHHPLRRHSKQHKAAAHHGRLHSHTDLDLHAPIRFLI